jgi:hypothetical protein
MPAQRLKSGAALTKEKKTRPGRRAFGMAGSEQLPGQRLRTMPGSFDFLPINFSAAGY